MFGIILYDVIFFAVPAILLVFFAISLYRYISAKRENEETPDTFSAEEIKKRKIILIVASIIAATLVAIVIGFIAMLFMAVAFM